MKKDIFAKVDGEKVRQSKTVAAKVSGDRSRISYSEIDASKLVSTSDGAKMKAKASETVRQKESTSIMTCSVTVSATVRN